MLQIEGLHDSPPIRSKTRSSTSSHDTLETDSPHQLGLRTRQPVQNLIITQLTSGVRNPNRVNVFIDGKFSFSLDVKQVVDFKIKVGQQLTDSELENLRAASEFSKLYQRTLEWVLTRPHSVRETRDYLKRRQLKRLQTNRKRIHDDLKPFPEIQPPTIDLVVERLIERGFLDDQRFAEYYVENRFIKKGISLKRLRSELTQKGISPSLINQVLENSNRDEHNELVKMAHKKASRYDRQKLIAYLVRQGFPYQDVIEVVDEIMPLAE